jgi:hypothetical protein
MFEPVKVFDFLFKIIKTFGLWQVKSSSWRYRIYGCFMHLFFIDFFTLFQFLFLFHFENIEELSDNISTLLTNFGEVLKTINFIFKITSVVKLVDSLKKLIASSECELTKNHIQIRKYVKQGWSLYKFLAASAVLTCALAGLVPVFNRQEHKLPYRMYYPYVDYKNNNLTFVLLALYEMSPIITCVIIMSLDMLPVLCMCFATGLFEELSIRLEHIARKYTVSDITENPRLIDDSKGEHDVQELLKCIEIHQGIRNFVHDTQDHFSTIIMVQGIMSSIIFCTTAFMLSLVSQVFVFPTPNQVP